MNAQNFKNRNRRGTGWAGERLTIAKEEYAFLAAAKGGDSAAFETLCKQSANTVFQVARRVMRNKEDAEDVVQESFQQAFIHLKSFHGDSRFSTWLSRIAINAALMKLRSMTRPKPKSRPPGRKSKTTARIPNSSTPNRNGSEFFPTP